MLHSLNLLLFVTTKLQLISTKLPNIFSLWFGGSNILCPLQPVPTLIRMPDFTLEGFARGRAHSFTRARVIALVMHGCLSL